MKLGKTPTNDTSFLWSDDGKTLLASGYTATLDHLLRCQAYLRILVATAKQPEHFGVLEKAKAMLDGFKEPVQPPVAVREVPFDEPVPAIDMETLRLANPLIPGTEY